MLKKILIVLAVIVADRLLGLAASRPDTFTIQCSIRIKAAPDKIFPLAASRPAWSS